MTIHVHLLGYLCRYSPTGEEKFSREIAPAATVADLLAQIRFPAEVEKIILVNGQNVLPATGLAAGDDVFIFAPATGG